MNQKIIDAVERFSKIVNSLECECDDGYTCTIHADKILAIKALDMLAKAKAKGE